MLHQVALAVREGAWAPIFPHPATLPPVKAFCREGSVILYADAHCSSESEMLGRSFSNPVL